MALEGTLPCLFKADAIFSHYEHVNDKDLTKFIEDLDTGDIILFRGGGIGPAMIRAGCRSKWDHVAVVNKRIRGVVRDPNRAIPANALRAKRRCTNGYCTCKCTKKHKVDQLELLEATYSGVHIYPLVTRLARRLVHDKYFAVRKLMGVERTASMRHCMEDWIQQSVGIGYSLIDKNYLKLIFKQKGNSVDEANIYRDMRYTVLPSKKSEIQRAFCTQLVASSLQACGILGQKKLKSTDMGPYSYSSDENREVLTSAKGLIGGAEYGHEVMLLQPKNKCHEELKNLKAYSYGQTKLQTKLDGGTLSHTPYYTLSDMAGAERTSALKRVFNSVRFSLRFSADKNKIHDPSQSKSPNFIQRIFTLGKGTAIYPSSKEPASIDPASKEPTPRALVANTPDANAEPRAAPAKELGATEADGELEVVGDARSGPL